MGLALLLNASPPVHTGSLADWQIAAACLIFGISYVVFALGKLPGLKIDRPGMAIIGATALASAAPNPSESGPSDSPTTPTTTTTSATNAPYPGHMGY